MSPHEIPSQSELDAVLEAQGFGTDGPPRPEGAALRVRVDLEEGARGLLYVWRHALFAQRAVWAHRPGRAAHLFAVPGLIEAGKKWCLVADIDGVPMNEYLADRGVDTLGELGSERARALVDSAGELARKLHEVEVPAAYGDVVEEADEDQPGYLRRWHTFNGYCAWRLEDFSERMRQADLDEKVRSRILNSIGDLRAELSSFHPRHPASLNHGSFGSEHLWVDQAGREVVGLTGFERARLLPAEADLGRFLWLEGVAEDEALVRAVYRGYGAARTMDLQRRERFYRRLAALEALLLDAYGDWDEERLVQLVLP